MVSIKSLWLLLVLVLLTAFAQAQTFDEWFSQKKTQIKYLIQQIAALEQYRLYIQQGYQIEQGDWAEIGHWVKGEFNLHSTYYTSLQTVNPVIRNNPKGDSIVIYAQLIPQQFDRLNVLNDDTRNYIGKVKASLLNETNKDLAELQLVMTDGKAQLTDDERINRIDSIYARVRDKLTFSQSFCNAVRLLYIQRGNSLNDINTLKSIYGIN